MNIYLYIGLYCVGWLVMLGALLQRDGKLNPTDYILATIWPVSLAVLVSLRAGRWLEGIGE